MATKAEMLDARTPLDVRPLPSLRVVEDDEPREERAEPIEVVLACSTADAEAIAASAAVLGIPGLRVLTGVERMTDTLRLAVQRATVPTLFVVCRGGGLDADHARVAASSFGTRRHVHHRLLVAQYEPDRPGPWMTAVRRAWTSMNAALEIDSGPVVGMLASSEYSVVGGEVRGAAEATERRSSGAPLVRISPASSMRMSAGDDSPLRDRVGTIPAHVRAPGQMQPPVALVSQRETEDDGPAAKSDAVLVRDPPSRPAAAPKVFSADRVLRMGASAVVAIVVVSFAAVPTLGDRRNASPAAALSDRSSAAIATALAEQEVPTAAPVETFAKVEPVVTVVPRDAIPPAPIVAAVEPEGRLAALFVVEGPTVALDWFAAANTCRGRQVDGTRGFRLPNIDELRWLRRNGRVRSGRAMWSGSRGSNGSDTNWIVDGKGAMGRLAKDATAFVVCVRTR